MPFTICAFNHDEWDRHGLADYGDFAEQTTECNVGEDSFSGYGEWFFVPDEPLPSGERVVYFGSWGNDHLLAQQELEDFEQADEYFGHTDY